MCVVATIFHLFCLGAAAAADDDGKMLLDREQVEWPVVRRSARFEMATSAHLFFNSFFSPSFLILYFSFFFFFLLFCYSHTPKLIRIY